MKKTIISTAFATASLFLIMGFTDNPQHNLVLSGENLVENLTDEQVTFVEKVSSNDVDYAGLYLYTDGNYNCELCIWVPLKPIIQGVAS